jgi:hypothetical protein
VGLRAETRSLGQEAAIGGLPQPVLELRCQPLEDGPLVVLQPGGAAKGLGRAEEACCPVRRPLGERDGREDDEAARAGAVVLELRVDREALADRLVRCICVALDEVELCDEELGGGDVGRLFQRSSRAKRLLCGGPRSSEIVGPCTRAVYSRW